MTLRSKPFRGWVVPGKHRSHLVGSVVGLRNSAHVFERDEPIMGSAKLERFVYVGCVHGGDEDIYQRLRQIAKSKPDYVIFAGDLTGSPQLEKLKSEFYRQKEKGKYKEFEYFGNFAKTLPLQVRRKLLTSIKISVSKLIKEIQSIKKSNAHIVLLEGNWDNPTISGVKMIAGRDIKDYFHTKKEFTRSGLRIVDRIETIETEATLHIVLPYITLLNFDKVSADRLREVARSVDTAREDKKTVVMVGHAEANWKIHHLRNKTWLRGERAVVVENFGRAIALFQPHEVIYPHQHARLHDEKGTLVDVDTKYLLSINYSEPGVQLVSHVDGNQIPRQDVIATYLPFGYVAEEDFLV